MFIIKYFMPGSVLCAENTSMTGCLCLPIAINSNGSRDRDRTFQCNLISAIHRVWQTLLVAAPVMVPSSLLIEP